MTLKRTEERLRGLSSSSNATQVPAAARVSANAAAMIARSRMVSICQDDVEEDRVEKVAVGEEAITALRVVERLEPRARQQRRPRRAQYDVLRIERPVGEGEREIVADILRDAALVAQEFERRGSDEAEIVEVRRQSELG